VFYEVFGGFEFMMDQHQEGALPGEVWERWSATLAWWISLPGVQAWWRARPAPFSADFTAFVDGLVELPRLDVEADERWRRFLATGDGESPPGDPAAGLSPASR
jgi:hypothetical protein